MIDTFIILVGFYINMLSQQTFAVSASSVNEVKEDDELNQALLLIDMLKPDYLKPSRNRSEVENSTAAFVQSTSSATTHSANDAFTRSSTRNESKPTILTFTLGETQSEFKHRPWSSSSPMFHAAPLFPWRSAEFASKRDYPYTSLPFYNMALPSQPRRFRPRMGPWRRFYSDYYFGDIYPRRFFKGPPPLTRRTPQTVTGTAAVHTAPTVLEDSSTTKTPTRASSKSKSKATPISLLTKKRRPLTPKKTTKKRILVRNTPKIIVTKDLVQEEVAIELLREFKKINITPKPKRSSTVGSTSSES